MEAAVEEDPNNRRSRGWGKEKEPGRQEVEAAAGHKGELMGLNQSRAAAERKARAATGQHGTRNEWGIKNPSEPRLKRKKGPRLKTCNIWRHPWDLVPNNHTTMSLDETTPVENQSHTTLSPGGTTVIQGKRKEEKEQQLKEARARLEFEDVSVEDVDEDDERS
ncbi:hypothetical protein E3N88_28588 [Mikania micrantha]|uniref:Uncharacterized protein n=1 Tax=Mikania micrantha TaxID=192012 RepID=A0A5N6N118_9ASTR|nr:hypothetical protein E3N88_28588 [Mikania micrantha]